MKRIVLMIAAAASVAAAMPIADPAFARDGDRDRRAERQEPARGRGMPVERRGRQDRGDERRDGPRDVGPKRIGREDRRAPDDRRRYEERGPRPSYMDGPRPNYMSPAPGMGGRRGFSPDSYRGGGVVEDYRRYRLRPPPQGYDWVRMGNGFALVERDSGRIFDRVD